MTTEAEAKKNFFQHVLQCLEDNSLIFGGAVRNRILGENYNDIDIWFPSEYARNRFLQRIKNVTGKYFYAETVEWDESGAYGTTDLERYFCQVDGHKIQLDLVCDTEDGMSDHNLDLDVNGLTMNNQGVHGTIDSSINRNDTIERIRRREFIQLQTLSHKRGSKANALINAGWKSVAQNRPIYEVYEVGDRVWFKDGYDGKIQQGEVVSNTNGLYRVRLDALVRGHITVVRDVFRADIVGLVVDPTLKNKATEKEGDKNVIKDKQMSEKVGVFETFKSDAIEGTFRGGAKQIPKVARQALLAFMKSKGLKKAWIKTVAEMLETEMGRAAIAQALGAAFMFIPWLKDDPKAIALAKEWRVDAWATVSNEILSELMIQFAPVFSMVSNLPEPPKVRVSADSKEDSKKSKDEDEETEEVPDLDAPATRAVA